MGNTAIVCLAVDELNLIGKKLKNYPIIAIDAGDVEIRQKNRGWFTDIEFWGPDERHEYLGDDNDIIPLNCHATMGFGLLRAWEQGYKYVIMIDGNHDPKGFFVEDHMDNLNSHAGEGIISLNGIYNPLEDIVYQPDCYVASRGYSHNKTFDVNHYLWVMDKQPCVMNMGLWVGDMDVDAMTRMAIREPLVSDHIMREKVIVEPTTYIPLSGRNIALRREVIPAFYQLYMNYNGIDHYGDVWSGLFLKRIVDHLGHRVCLGKPTVKCEDARTTQHNIRHLVEEMSAFFYNETLWNIVPKLTIEGRTYHECYLSLIHQLSLHFQEDEYMMYQLDQMLRWVDLVGRLE